VKSGFALILDLVDPARDKTRVSLSSKRTGLNCTRGWIKYPCASQCNPSGIGLRDEGLAWSRRRGSA